MGLSQDVDETNVHERTGRLQSLSRIASETDDAGSDIDFSKKIEKEEEIVIFPATVKMAQVEKQ